MNDRISKLEDRKAELAKEILLNESAIYEAESELGRMEIYRNELEINRLRNG